MGAALITGSAQLQKGPVAWPDLIASSTVVHRAAAVMLALGLGAGAAGIVAALDVPWGREAAMLMTLIVVVVAFWGNRVLFGAIRPAHMVTNMVVLAIVVVLLWRR